MARSVVLLVAHHQSAKTTNLIKAAKQPLIAWRFLLSGGDMGDYSVYKHTFPNGKVYIGITRQKIKKRWMNGLGYRHCPVMRGAISKYGWENVEHEVIQTGLDVKEASDAEKALIVKYKSDNIKFGYNMESGGVGSEREVKKYTFRDVTGKRKPGKSAIEPTAGEMFGRYTATGKSEIIKHESHFEVVDRCGIKKTIRYENLRRCRKRLLLTLTKEKPILNNRTEYSESIIAEYNIEFVCGVMLVLR